jgi:hypothetical protein
VESVAPRVLSEAPVLPSDPAASLPVAVGAGLLAEEAEGAEGTDDLPAGVAAVAAGLPADAGAGLAGAGAVRPRDGVAHRIRQAAPSNHPAAAA